MKNVIKKSFLLVVIILWASVANAQWEQVSTTFFSNSTTMKNIISRNGTIWVTIDNSILISKDTGKTWFRCPLPENNGVVWNIDAIDANIFLVTQDSSVYITSDVGKSWSSILKLPFQSLFHWEYPLFATFGENKDNIVVSYNEGSNTLWSSAFFTHTNDGGKTWTSIQYPGLFSLLFTTNHRGIFFTCPEDSSKPTKWASLYSNDGGLQWKLTDSLMPMTEAISLAIDSCNNRVLYFINDDASFTRPDTIEGAIVMKSIDGGSTWSPKLQRFNALTDIQLSINNIFVGSDTSGVFMSANKGESWISIGGPKLSDDQPGLTVINDSVIIVIANDNTIWRTFNCGGHMKEVHSFDPIWPNIITKDCPTDTIFGEVHVPISLDTLGKNSDIELVVHYDSNLTYLGTFSVQGKSVDVPGESWEGRAKIHIPNATSGSILGFADFSFIRDSSAGSHVSFDSLFVANAEISCKTPVLNIAISSVFPPSGCGVKLIWQYLEKGKITDFTIFPNPVANSLSIQSTMNLSNTNFTIFDQLGRSMLHQHVLDLTKDNKMTLDVSHLSSGTYFLRLEANGFSKSHKVVINH